MNKIIKMSASWCAPCSQMDKQLSVIKEKLPNLLIENVDIDISSDLVIKYKVRSIPTLIKLDSAGEEISRSIGSVTDAKLLEFLS